MPQPDIESRVKRAIDGSTPDLVFLLQFHRPAVLAQLQQTLPVDLRAELDAEDLLQETFISVVEDLPKFTYTGEDSFLGWMMTIARHRCLDQIRRARAAKRGGRVRRIDAPPSGIDGRSDFGGDLRGVGLASLLAVTSHTASRSVSRREAVESLRKAVSALPSVYRQVVLLHHLEGLPLVVVGSRMGRSPNAVQKLAVRALRALSEAMGGHSSQHA